MRVPSFEAVGDHVMAALMREGFNHELPRPGQAGAASLHFQPFAHTGGKARPLRAATPKPPHPPGKGGAHGHERSPPLWNGARFGPTGTREWREEGVHAG